MLVSDWSDNSLSLAGDLMLPRSFSRSCSSAVITGSCFCWSSVARSSSSPSGDFTATGSASAFGDSVGVGNFFSVNLHSSYRINP